LVSDPEVEHLHDRSPARLLGQKKVLRLQVAMHDAKRVGLHHGLAGLEQVPDCILDWQRAVLLELRREVMALQVLHDHEGRSVLEPAHVDDSGHVLAVDLGRSPGFAGEALHDLGHRPRVGEQALDRDALVEVDVARRNDDAHTPGTQHLLDPIFAGENIAFAQARRRLHSLIQSRLPPARSSRGTRQPPQVATLSSTALIARVNADARPRTAAKADQKDRRLSPCDSR
jgi:hypothetical protein